MALPLIGALAGLGRVAAGTTARRVGYGAALGDLAKDAVVGAGKGFVGGLKGAMMSEAPGLTGAYAFGKELRNRANAPKALNNKALSSGGSSNSSSSSAMGAGLTSGISTVAGQQKQSNVINLEQVRQLRQLNNNVINQSKLIAFQVNESKRKELFAEELANEQALRDDKLLEAIRNIGGGGRGGAANNNGLQEGSGGGFLSGLVGSLAGGAGQAALTKLVPFLSATMAALPWARILRLATPLGAAASLTGSTPNKETQQRQNTFYSNKETQEAQKRAAEEAKDEPRPVASPKGNYRNAQRIWDEKYQGRKDPVSGKTLSGIYNIPASGKVSSTFGSRSSPGGVGSTNHMGVDIASILGSPVNSIASGTVVGVDREGGAPDANGIKKGLGRYVVVDHGQGVISKYAHLSEVSVNKGDKVGPGVILGKSGGNTEDPGSGASTGAHLHLEVTNNGTQIDPSSLGGLQALQTKNNEVKLGAAAGLPGTGNAAGATSSTLATPAAAAQRRKDAFRGVTVDPNAVTNYSGKFPDIAASKFAGMDPVSSKSLLGFGGGDGGNGVVGGGYDFRNLFGSSKFGDNPNAVKLAFGGFLPGGGEGGNNSPYALNYKGPAGTGIKFKNTEVATHDSKLFKLQKTVAEKQGFVGAGTATKTSIANAGTALQTKVLKPLFKSNSDIIKETNEAFLKQFKSVTTGIFTQVLTKTLFPKGFGVSASAGAAQNYRGQQLQQIFGTNKVIDEATTKLLGKQYGPMFAPLFNNLAQGYLEVGARITGKQIFQTIGGLGADETMGLTSQVLGNFAAGNKKLALEQLLYGASGGQKSGIALGPETILAKYGFKNPAEGIAYFASGLADMATAPIADFMGGDKTNGVRFDPRANNGQGGYVNRDGTSATPEQYAAASRQYGASLNQGPLFGVANDNFGGARQDGYNPNTTTQMQGGTVVQGYGQQYGPRPGQFRVVAPTVNAITGVSTAPNAAQAFGLTPQQQAGLSKQELELQQATHELAKIKAVKDAEAQGKILKENAELRAQGKSEAEAQEIRDGAARQENALVTDANAKFIVSGLGGQKPTGGGSAIPGTGALKPGDPGYRPGQLFQKNSTDGTGMQFGKEVGNFAFDMGKNALGNQLTKGISNPYTQMVANFAIQKGLNYGFEAIKNSDFITNMFSSTASSAGGSFVDTAVNWVSSLFGFAGGGPVAGGGAAKLSNGEYVVSAPAALENFGLLSLINALGLSGITDALGISSTTGTGHQVVSSNGVYNGFSMSKDASGTTIVDKPSYYDIGKTIGSYGKSISDFGGLLGMAIPGKGLLGAAGQFIGSMMTAPYDRQSDFWGNMDAGINGRGGAVSIGNGMFAMIDGSVYDATGTMIGGTVVDSRGNPIGVGSGGTLGFGVGTSQAAINAAQNRSETDVYSDQGLTTSPASQTTSAESGYSPGDSNDLARGGPVTGPGSGTSDSIPAMLSSGEFVVNAKAAKKYRPLLDALNVKHLAEGTPAASGSVKDMAKVLGTTETNSQLAISNETLTSIDGSLRTISGQGTGSGTSVSGTSLSGMGGTGMSFDIGLGPRSGGGSVSSGGGGGSRGSPRAPPTTMDMVGGIAKSIATGYLVRTGIGIAANAIAPGIAYEMAIANLAAGGGVSGFVAGAGVGIEMIGAGLAEAGLAAMTAIEGALVAMGPVGWTALAIIAAFAIYGGGGGGSSPPPKLPKYHAAMYVAGNNNIDAITPMYETTEYHAPPEAYKTIAYGLLRVVFNATKSAEVVTKMSPSYDFVYMKVQHDKISMVVGKGAPNLSSLSADSATDALSWPAPTEGTNLSTIAQDIIHWVRDDFKKLASAENLNKLIKAAEGLGTYTLNELSSGLIPDLKRGEFALNKNMEKGIYANNVAESNRIAELIRTSASKGAYMSDPTGDTYDDNGNLIPGSAAKNMIYSMKQGKFVENPFGLDAILLDQGDRPVYNIAGTSAGLSIDDFGSATVVGANRPANILTDTPASTGGAGSTTVTTVTGPTVDNTAITNYYTPVNGVIDIIRGAASNVT